MFTQFGATAETLSKASSMVFRIGTDAHLYDDPEDVSIAPLLDSKFDSEKCEALKRLLALIAQGFDVSNFFPQVTCLYIHTCRISRNFSRLVPEKTQKKTKKTIHSSSALFGKHTIYFVNWNGLMFNEQQENSARIT